MKRLVFFFIIFVFIFIAASASWYAGKLHTHAAAASTSTHMEIKDAKLKASLDAKARDALSFCQNNNLNTQYCFLLNMRIESGKQRFFVYDMQRNGTIKAGLVTHGSCNTSWLNGRKYSNNLGCGCTSLGKYKIGNPYHGRFGLAYKLFGLEASNSNAYSRFVVLHSMTCIPEQEVYPYPICQSEGCPAVAASFLKEIANIIDASKDKQILLWIYE
jgi:hypothetical protein